MKKYTRKLLKEASYVDAKEMKQLKKILFRLEQHIKLNKNVFSREDFNKQLQQISAIDSIANRIITQEI